MFCSKCGYQVGDDACFCPKCGNKIDALTESLQEKPVDENLTSMQEKSVDAVAETSQKEELVIKEHAKAQEPKQISYNVVVTNVGVRKLDFMKLIMDKFHTNVASAKKISESAPFTFDVCENEEDAVKLSSALASLGVETTIQTSEKLDDLLLNSANSTNADAQGSVDEPVTMEKRKKMYKWGSVLAVISSVLSLLSTVLLVCLPLYKTRTTTRSGKRRTIKYTVIVICYNAIDAFISSGLSIDYTALYSMIYMFVAVAVISILASNIKMIVKSIIALVKADETFNSMTKARYSTTIDSILKVADSSKTGKQWASLISEIVLVVFMIGGNGQLIAGTMVAVICCAVVGIVLDKVEKHLQDKAVK